MKQSSLIQEWRQEWLKEGKQMGKQEGRAEGAALMLLHYLGRRFGGDVPADLRTQIEGQTDLELLDRWFDQALGAASLDQFRATLPPHANGQ
jgi:predicted transposase YdaD